MTTIFTTFRASLLACTIAAAPAFARDYVAVVPQATSDDRFVHELVLDLVLEQLGQGDTLRLVDGTSLATVATFQIPDDRRAEVPNLRRRALTGPMNDWAAFVARHYIDATPAAGEDGRLFIPQALDLVAQAHADRPVEDREVCVLIVGSARYEDPREDVFDMTGARVPSDGLIVAPRARSPFGTGDRQGDLAGVSVSILSRGDSWPSDLAEMRVGRVWGLHLQGRGGVMATFGSDPRTAIDSFLDCRSKPARTYFWDTSRSVEAMLELSRNAAFEAAPEPEAEAPVEPAPVTSIPVVEMPVDLQLNEDWLTADSFIPSDQPPEFTRATLEIGIRWGDAGCSGSDADIYLRSGPDEQFIYWNNVETPEGRLHKDHQSAPDAANGWEYVTVTRPVEIATLELLVNFYAGRCPGGLRGTVRALIGTQPFEQPFHIEAERGDSGRGLGQQGDPHWVRIDPRDLFNLR